MIKIWGSLESDVKYRIKIIFYCVIIIILTYLVLFGIYRDQSTVWTIFLMLGVGMTYSGALSLILHIFVQSRCCKSFYVKRPSAQISKLEAFGLLSLICYTVFALTSIPVSNITNLSMTFTTFTVIWLLVTIASYMLIGISVPLKYRPIDNLIETLFYCFPLFNYESLLSARIKENHMIENCEYPSYRGLVVRSMNYCNLVVSVILSLIFIETFHGFSIKNEPLTIIYLIYFCMLVARTIARSMEIMHAFFNDTMDRNKKKTDIKPPDRIKLAVSSLVEITFLFAPVYLYFHKVNSKIYNNISSLYFSFGVTTFKGIDVIQNSNAANLLMMLQILTSMTLTIFTIARYIGEIKAHEAAEIRSKKGK